MMHNVSILLRSAFELEGTKGIALGDYRSGEILNLESRMGNDMQIAVTADTDLIRAKICSLYQLGQTQSLEEIFITLSDENHIIRLVKNYDGLFLHLVLERVEGALALARIKLLEIEEKLVTRLPLAREESSLTAQP